MMISGDLLGEIIYMTRSATKPRAFTVIRVDGGIFLWFTGRKKV